MLDTALAEVDELVVLVYDRRRRGRRLTPDQLVEIADGHLEREDAPLYVVLLLIAVGGAVGWSRAWRNRAVVRRPVDPDV